MASISAVTPIDGKPDYLAMHPRIWNYLQRNFAHPALAPVKDWFDEHVPEAKRASALQQVAR